MKTLLLSPLRRKFWSYCTLDKLVLIQILTLCQLTTSLVHIVYNISIKNIKLQLLLVAQAREGQTRGALV